MPKSIEHIHWPDAPDMWMPYAPAIKVVGGTTIYLAGVTAALVYHHHPHRPADFYAMPGNMGDQTKVALEQIKKGPRCGRCDVCRHRDRQSIGYRSQ